MIFRNDDINPSTDYIDLQNKYSLIKDAFPKCQIISSVNVLGKANEQGSVYPGTPFKDKPLKWFYNVDCINNFKGWELGKVASHGLFHFDHTQLSKEKQEFSIIVSCEILNTKAFVPPFNRYNKATSKICKDNGIQLLAGKEWKNFEYEIFDPKHKYWYFHSWKWRFFNLKELLNEHSANVG